VEEEVEGGCNKRRPRASHYIGMSSENASTRTETDEMAVKCLTHPAFKDGHFGCPKRENAKAAVTANHTAPEGFDLQMGGQSRLCRSMALAAIPVALASEFWILNNNGRCQVSE